MTTFLLEHGADPNALSDYGESPLHLALRTSLHGTKYQDDWVDPYLRVERLWDFVDPEEDDIDAVIADISEHRVAVLDALLSDPRTSFTIKDCKDEYPFHCIQYNQAESTTVIQKLVSKGADPSCGNSKQQTALHFASRAGDYESVIALLGLGADLTLTDDDGLNALHYAAQSGNHKTLIAILDTERAETANLVASRGKHGMNALHHLLSKAFLNQAETVQLLLSRGVNGTELDESGASPFTRYFLSSKLSINVQICQLLLEIEGNASFVDNDGQTLGHLCAGSLGFGVHILRVLKEHNVDMSKRDLKGRTVLHRAAISGSITEDSLEYLRNVVGLQPSAEDSCGKTALAYAAELAAKDRSPHIWDAKRWERTKNILVRKCPASIA
jgi:ankyrin repeat protein